MGQRRATSRGAGLGRVRPASVRARLDASVRAAIVDDHPVVARGLRREPGGWARRIVVPVLAMGLALLPACAGSSATSGAEVPSGAHAPMSPAGADPQRSPGLGTAPADVATPSGGSGGAPTWERVALPAGVVPLRLAAEGERLVVGGQRTDQRPTVHVVLAGELTSLRVAPQASSPYAALARWRSLTLAQGRLTGIGGAPGGAHSNTRWTAWDAELVGDWPQAVVTERPQPFETFGGWEAGELVDAVATYERTYLVGSWRGSTALDVAVWRADGTRWVREDSAATPLASTPTELVGVAAARSTGPGILVVGSVTRLGEQAGSATPAGSAGAGPSAGGGVRRVAAAWRSARGSSQWVRIDLPDAGATSEARSAACDPQGCAVAGVSDGRYALWWVPATGEPSRVSDVPDVPVARDADATVDAGGSPAGAPVSTGTPQDSAPASATTLDPLAPGAELPDPVLRGSRVWCLVGDALLERVEGVWRAGAGVPGRARTVAVAADTVYVIAGDDAHAALWRTEWPNHE